jgi:hypothetical protein
MAHATFRERPPRTNAPMQPRNREGKMELVECQTCGSHSFTNGKCDYCGNQYEVKQRFVKELKIAPLSDYMKSLTNEEAADIYNNLKDGLTPNQIRTATCKEDITKQQEITFEHGNKRGDKVLTVMLYLLLSIVWFAVTIFIPPLFIITIILLVVYGAFRLTIKKK